MKRHHSVEISYHKVRRICLAAGKKAKQVLCRKGDTSSRATPSIMIMQADGVMVPIVGFREDQADRRKGRKIEWRELKLCCTRDQHAVDRLYSYSFKDDNLLATQVSLRLREQGYDDSKIHGVGDGAPWIVEFGEKVAGANYQHTIDFFHLSEYLHKASENCSDPERVFSALKEAARHKGIRSVSARLRHFKRQHSSSEKVDDCLRYIRNRPGQFEYARARELGLPIGSGEIEGSNRAVIQQRLKLSGCWWLPQNIDSMAALRVLRANGQFDQIWEAA